MDEWLRATAADLGRGIEKGRIDPVDLTEAHLSAIDAHAHKDRIYARVTADLARAQAKAASDRAKAGVRRSPLDGVPISWKDLFDTAGIVTEAGSALLKDRIPDRDAVVLQNAVAAGTVCLGKTHMSELAFSGLGYNPVTATPPNVNDEAGAPGGSSSGAATSVAFGLAAAGIGSDTGGSVRLPAAWNDQVGLKTRPGRLSLQGVVPLAVRFDTVGPLCRTVEDAALLLAVLENGKPADLSGATLKGARLLSLDTARDGEEDGPRAAFEDAVSRLTAAGAVVETAHLPEVAEALEMSALLLSTEAYATWRDKIEAAPERMFAEVRARFRAGRDFSGADYVAGWQKLDRLRDTYARNIAAYDAVILPTSPILPPNVARLATDSDYYRDMNLAALRNTRIGNLMGLAGLTLPTSRPSCGILFQGPSEECLLRLGSAAESALS
ncbi:MAG: amidase [Rhodobacteraceae bacterium]|nr:MAG: amidase [Paracoccaceae bacterium]